MKKTPTDSLGFLIHDAARLLRRRFEARGSEYGLSAAQWRLLVHLVRHEQLPQARLAELLEIEPISVSRLIDRMEQSGWVERRPSPADRRVRLVHPTEKSLTAFNEVRAMAGEVYDAALDGLTRAERDTLMHGLRTITRNLADNPEETAAGDKTKDERR